ncbi:hypothetical protein [Cereibacter ovatus]|uniref:hypothetical protein n=1 Tax=Cereibacter ovatus TaxID=439529 RepID=UPI000BE237F4|nr:hypothetical protein [Cereibacter ovatus]
MIRQQRGREVHRIEAPHGPQDAAKAHRAVRPELRPSGGDKLDDQPARLAYAALGQEAGDLGLAGVALAKRAWAASSYSPAGSPAWCFLPFLRKDRTLKPWDQTPSPRILPEGPIFGGDTVAGIPDADLAARSMLDLLKQMQVFSATASRIGMERGLLPGTDRAAPDWLPFGIQAGSSPRRRHLISLRFFRASCGQSTAGHGKSGFQS